MAIRVLLTGTITLAYCLVWMLLEYKLYGEIQGRIVDDFIMLLFIPVIWKATENIFKE
jgi:hypothetical protein